MGNHGSGAAITTPLSAEAAAAWSTAYATWALFAATVVLAILTYYVVHAAFVAPEKERAAETAKEREDRTTRNVMAMAAVAEAEKFIRQVKAFLDKPRRFEQFELWDLMNPRSAWTRLLTYYLNTDLGDPITPQRIVFALQALDEVRDALARLTPKEIEAVRSQNSEQEKAPISDESYIKIAETSRDTARRALERLDAANKRIRSNEVSPTISYK